VGRVVAGGRDVGDRVVRVVDGAGHVVGGEGRVDDLEQALGRGALGGVGVPVVDGLRVARGLADDVAVDALVAAGDAVLGHDGERLLDPAVEVVRVRDRLGGRSGFGGGRALRGEGGARALRAVGAVGALLGAVGGLGLGLVRGLVLGLAAEGQL